MKKILVALLATASVAAFADSFQDFNNNVYAGYNNTSINQGQFGTANSWTLGSTIQSKNNFWANLEANDSVYQSQFQLTPDTQLPIGSNYAQALVTAKVGYAFQFFGDETNGLQVIPYATYTYGTTMTNLNQYYGMGVKPEYRLMNNLKLSLDMTAYDATQSNNTVAAYTLPDGSGAANAGFNGTNSLWAGQYNDGFTQDFRYTLNPEVQYDIAKTVLVAAGYKYDQSFNSVTPNSDGNSTVYVKVGYLF